MIKVFLDSLGVSTIIILLLIIMNGIFSMTELAIVTSRKVRLDQKAKEGSPQAQTALRLAEKPNELLSTIQIGITLIGIVTGAFGGAALSGKVAVLLDRVDVLAPFSQEISMVLVIVLTTYLSLIVGELVPKQIALVNPEKAAMIVARPMYWFSVIGKPVIWILSKSTALVLKMLGVKKPTKPDVTEEEIQQLVEQGVYSGAVEEIEHEMVDQIFYMSDKRLGDILTPRTQLVWIDVESSFEENMRIISDSYHSRFPVGKGSLDEFLGIIHTKKVFRLLLKGEKFSIEDCIEETLLLPEHMKVFQALETVKKSGMHEAVVVDEYGGIEGFVTLHDFMENIFGDLPYREEEEEPQITRRDDSTWLADGLVSVDTFIRYFDLEDEMVMDSGDYHTLGGFLTSYLGDIPEVGDVIKIRDLKLEIVDMDHVRVDKIMITRQEKTSEAG
ncbi:HlyC/CorC family transporter [Thermoactinomyces sp. AMNI-1]|uniref:HlyC/CorC family transporter n=2 Tax=Thermoactinomyces mirandus TaxID=2756294 RepID=A0A7W1XSL5_9BACL|nr:HlyC/CorC family transporter [Thermoactinomyces mirandus]